MHQEATDKGPQSQQKSEAQVHGLITCTQSSLPPLPHFILSSQEEGIRSFRAPEVHTLNWILQGKSPQK